MSEELWLPRRGIRSEARLVLFAFPHAGGGSAAFHRWAADCPPQFNVVPLLLPGRERRIAETPYYRISDAATDIAKVLNPYVDRPYAFFGHSMGSLLAFEVARELRRRGRPLPAHLFAAAFRAPHRPAPRPAIHPLPEAEFIAAIQERFQGIPPEVAASRELLDLFLPTLRADITAVERYEYATEPPLPCPITALGGTDDKEVSFADLAAWRQETTGAFTQKLLPGGHFFVTTHSQETARLVFRQLERMVR